MRPLSPSKYFADAGGAGRAGASPGSASSPRRASRYFSPARGAAHAACEGPALAKRLVVVGQAPCSEGAVDEEPLRGVAERKLARLAGLSSPEALWRVADRLNLVLRFPGARTRLLRHARESGYVKHQSSGHAFPVREAAHFARELDVTGRYAFAVVLGLGAARALGIKRPRLLQRAELDGGRCHALVFPHPSGASHFWNDAVRVGDAAGALRAFIAEAVCDGGPDEVDSLDSRRASAEDGPGARDARGLAREKRVAAKALARPSSSPSSPSSSLPSEKRGRPSPS